MDSGSIEDYDMEQNQIRQNNNNRYNNIRVLQNKNNINRSPSEIQYERNYYYDNRKKQNENIQNMNKYIKNVNNEENYYDDVDDVEGQNYDSRQMERAKEDNYKILNNNYINRKEVNIENINYDKEDEFDQDQENEEHEEAIIQERDTQNDEIYRENENIQEKNGKHVKNIETEINEKYYDNQGNYLGEKKIITTEQVPIDEGQQEEYYEEQEEQEEQEENENENEYMPYQSSNKKFKKRGENIVRRVGPRGQNIAMNESDYGEDKIQSHLDDDKNNIYYKIKGSSEENKNKNYKKPIKFGIQSENLFVPSEDAQN
jgi:hypothetical protein